MSAGNGIPMSSATYDQYRARLRTQHVLDEVLAERARQTGKHGDQSHLPLGFGRYGMLPGLPAYRDRVPVAWLEVWARDRCKAASQNEGGDGSITFEHIVTEEWAELLGAATPDEARAEAVQLAAVAVQIVEAIDRQREVAEEAITGE